MNKTLKFLKEVETKEKEMVNKRKEEESIKKKKYDELNEKNDAMNKNEKLYIDYFIQYKESGYLNILSQEEILNVRQKYLNKEYDEKMQKILEIASFNNIENDKNQIKLPLKFKITNETTSFQVEHIYDACSIIKNWWYFKDFNIFANTQISKEIFYEWTVFNYNGSISDIFKKNVDEIVNSLPILNIDYVTFMY